MSEIIERALLASALFAIDGGGLITRSFPYPIVFINTEQYEAGFAALGDRYWGLHGVGDDIAGFPGKV
jgi:hypothetical protein